MALNRQAKGPEVRVSSVAGPVAMTAFPSWKRLQIVE